MQIWGIEIMVMLCMIGINGVFAAYEIALTSLSLSRIRRLVETQRKGAVHALQMKQNMEASLAVVQLGITLVGAIAAAVGGAGAEEKIAPILMEWLGLRESLAETLSIVLVVLPLTAVTITVGELIPKVFALRNTERVCLGLSPFMRAFSAVVWPVVWLFERVVLHVMTWVEATFVIGKPNRPESAALEDLRSHVALARSAQVIGHREEKIILGATELRLRPVKKVMLPAPFISTLVADASLTENLISAHLDMHTRFPVVEVKGNPQTIVGYVNVKDIIATLKLSPQEPSLRGILRSIPSVTEDIPISECLEILMHQHTHIALVRNGSNKVVGLIAMEDIMEELVGEIEDEYDRLPNHVLASGSSWIVGGSATLEQIRINSGMDFSGMSERDLKSRLTDWVAAKLGREVEGGDVLQVDNLRILVRKIRRKKVQEAQISRMPVHSEKVEFTVPSN